MEILLPFSSSEQYRRFVYEDYPFELYGKCPIVDKNLGRDLNEWLEFELPDEDIEVMFVSPMECDLTIQSTYSFLAKIIKPEVFKSSLLTGRIFLFKPLLSK